MTLWFLDLSSLRKPVRRHETAGDESLHLPRVPLVSLLEKRTRYVFHPLTDLEKLTFVRELEQEARERLAQRVTDWLERLTDE